MKKKALLLSVVSLMALTGCGKESTTDKDSKEKEPEIKTPDDNGHKASGLLQHDETRHWYKCSVEGCNDKFLEEFHDYGAWIYDSYATQGGWFGQTNPGKRHRVCETCEYVQEEEHNYTEGNVHECTFETAWSHDDNYHWNKCTGKVNNQPCDKKEHYEQHKFGDWVIDNYAVIKHDAAGFDDEIVTIGNKHRTCSVCLYEQKTTHTEEEPLAEHTHHYDNVWQKNETHHWHQCDFGKTVGYGGRDTYPCTEKNDYEAHNWDGGVQTKAPTTTSEGITTYTCLTCSGTKTESIAPLVDNTDGSETITVNFNKLQGKQAATVNSDTKAYLDAMKADQKNILEPYKVQKLDNGIDVANYLNKDQHKDSAGQGHNKPDGLTLSWDKGTMDYDTAIIKYATKADMSDALEVATTGTSVKINNLYANTKYYYQLTYTKGTTLYKSNLESFETADYIRFIDMGLVYNVRDMGGYKTSYGGRVKQGLIYRGSELTPKEYTDSNGKHPKNIDAEVMQLQKDVLKISVEIDHRSSGEAPNLPPSPLSTTEWPVEYRRDGYKVSAYDGFLNAGSTEIKNIYAAFAEAGTKHVYFHCIGGADRTGCAAFVLLGLLGVSYSDAVTDFEVTTATNYPRSRYFNNGSSPYYSRFPDFYNAFIKASWYNSSKTFAENCAAFLKSKGVTDATIEQIRSTMIEDYGGSSGTGTGDSGNTGTGTGTGTNTGGNTETPVITNECAHTYGAATAGATSASAYNYKVCSKCGAQDFYWDVNTASSDSAKKPDKLGYKLGSNNDEVTYKITVDKAYTGKFYLFGFVDNYTNSSDSNKNCGFFSGKNNGGGSNNNGSSPNVQITINGTAINITNKKTYVEMGVQKGSDINACAMCEVGDCELKQGENIIKWKRLDSYGLTVYSLHFVGLAK